MDPNEADSSIAKRSGSGAVVSIEHGVLSWQSHTTASEKMTEIILQAPQPVFASDLSPPRAVGSVNHSKSEISVVALPEAVSSRASSPTPSEKEELKEVDGTIRRMFRKESWKDREFVSK